MEFSKQEAQGKVATSVIPGSWLFNQSLGHWGFLALGARTKAGLPCGMRLSPTDHMPARDLRLHLHWLLRPPCPHSHAPLPVSSGSTSLRDHLHIHSHLRACLNTRQHDKRLGAVVIVAILSIVVPFTMSQETHSWIPLANI